MASFACCVLDGQWHWRQGRRTDPVPRRTNEGPPLLASFALLSLSYRSPLAELDIMSSWDRARYVPWDRIPQSGENLDAQKERIFRQLQKESIEEDLQLHDRSSQQSVDPASKSTSTKVPFSTMILLRQAAFGGCIGAITGGVFGFMDGMRTAGESPVLQKASNMAKGRYLFQGTTRSATLFGVFFGGFHCVKYGIRVTLDPGELSEIGMASVVSCGALMSRPAWRPSMPYSVMLIFMDSVHYVMRQTS